MAQLLYMLGVEPVWLPNGKVRSFRIIPLSELGRPRIDVTVKISGILRDNFQNCINLVDDAIHAVAALNEPEDQNFIRKHTLEAMRDNQELTFDDAAARLFGAQPGTYTAGVNLLIYSSSWEQQGISVTCSHSITSIPMAGVASAKKLWVCCRRTCLPWS